MDAMFSANFLVNPYARVIRVPLAGKGGFQTRPYAYNKNKIKNTIKKSIT
jgi:hypothetical protein